MSSCAISAVDIEGDGDGRFKLVMAHDVSGSSNWTACSLLDVTLPAGVARDKSSPSSSSSTIRRRLLLMDCTALSELLVVTVVDTAAFFV